MTKATMIKPIEKILIANRGEIALRVMKTARAMGIKTVAVYSDADASAPHVAFANEAVNIGPAPVNQSYLVIDNIINAAKSAGADAIHPGYGFLSENAQFAKACADNELIFIGPPIGAIDVMGDKAKSKRAMIAAGVPCIPGYQGQDQNDDVLVAESKSIGFPLMVKAAAGGGGRGMRLVHKAGDLAEAIKLARSEAINAFGSGELIIEKAIIAPRHVEIQVFADAHGNTIHLGERDCSVQRRHQKVIEESPCPVMTEAVRAAMGKAAIEAAKAVDYVGAGTVEFLLAADMSFYFLEMNTRLQVEHPVTEMVTGVDLVKMQIRAAQGEPLALTQDDIKLTGHAIEVRLYAEDAQNDFMPSTGHIDLWQPPIEGSGVRVDAGIITGGAVSPYYDSMVAKIIGYGETRDQARRKLISALEQTALIGPANNRDFLIDALAQERFATGEATTAFISEVYGDQGFEPPAPDEAAYAMAALIQHSLSHQRAAQLAASVSDELMGWSNMGPLRTPYLYNDHTIIIESHAGALQVHIGNDSYDAAITLRSNSAAQVTLDGVKHAVNFYAADTKSLILLTAKTSHSFTNIAGGVLSDASAGASGVIAAPMHGLLLSLEVEAGQKVNAGDRLAVLEAMKMQHEIRADIDGVVTEISAKAGAQIAADDLILTITPEEA